jgi:hypothetical protein
MIRGIYRMTPRQFNRRSTEVRAEPFGKGKRAGYAHCTVYQEHDQIPVVLDGIDLGRIAVASLLP